MTKLMVDNSASEKQNLINYINQALPTGTAQITVDDIDFSVPRAIVPTVPASTVDHHHPNDTYVYNTEITVSAKGSYTWEHPYVLSYRRVDLQTQWDIYNTGVVTIDLKDLDITPENIKNELYKVLPIRIDSVSCDIRAGSDELHRNVVFTPIPNSLLYIGELLIEYKVKSTVVPKPKPVDNRIDLDTVFGGGDVGLNNDSAKGLDGFEYQEK